MEDDAWFDTIMKVTEMCAKTPTEWKWSIDSRNLEASKTVSVQGFGLLGIISLNGKITQIGDKFEYLLSATCLPLHTDKKGFANSLEEAKRLLVQAMETQSGALTGTLLTMQEMKARKELVPIKSKGKKWWQFWK